MNQARATRLAPRRREPALSGAGGLIVVGGPPFHGKSVLAAHLGDVLPLTRKLEAVDNLSARSEYWDAAGTTERPHSNPLARMLKAAAEILARGGAPPPVVIIAARAGSPALRQLAKRTAASIGVRFLHVEALAHNIRAFERLSSLMLPKDELLTRMRRYELATGQYVRVGADEAKTLPAVRIRNVLSDLDAATAAVLGKWLAG